MTVIKTIEIFICNSNHTQIALFITVITTVVITVMNDTIHGRDYCYDLRTRIANTCLQTGLLQELELVAASTRFHLCHQTLRSEFQCMTWRLSWVAQTPTYALGGLVT